MKYLLFFLFVLFFNKYQTQCVTYYNGVTYDTEFKNAAENLCTLGIIGNTFNVSHMYDWITRKELSVLLVNTLFTSSVPNVSLYPYPYIDLNNLSLYEKNAMLIMLYLEYPDKTNTSETDGIAPFSREYFNARPNQAINNESAMRMILEACNYTIDWSGYSKPNSNYTNFYSDIRYNNPNYGWIKTGYNYNLLLQIYNGHGYVLSPIWYQCRYRHLDLKLFV